MPVKSKWISPYTYGGTDYDIPCREIKDSHTESQNSLNGNPVYKTRLEIPWHLVDAAIGQLLGKPEIWPYFTPFTNVRCIEANVINNGGQSYITDDKQEKLMYDHALVDVTYIPRIGIYVEDYLGQEVYWEDSIEPRYEDIPQNHKDFIWGKADDETVPTKKIPLHPDDTPSRPLPGFTLTHMIEGWYEHTSDIGDYLGSTNATEYYSRTLNQKFPIGTLMLRNYTVQKAYTFNSYRLPIIPTPDFDADVELPRDPSGRANNILKFVYEYRKQGWQKFWRNDPDTQLSGYYYIKYNASPFDTVKWHSPVAHDKWLKYTNLLT